MDRLWCALVSLLIYLEFFDTFQDILLDSRDLLELVIESL